MSQLPFPALSHTILLKSLTQVKLIFLVFPSTWHFIYIFLNQKLNMLSPSIFLHLLHFFHYPWMLSKSHNFARCSSRNPVSIKPSLPPAWSTGSQAVRVHLTQGHVHVHLFFDRHDYLLFIIVIYICIFSCQFSTITNQNVESNTSLYPSVYKMPCV